MLSSTITLNSFNRWNELYRKPGLYLENVLLELPIYIDMPQAVTLDVVPRTPEHHEMMHWILSQRRETLNYS